jgi:hypothetical protein
MKHRLSAVELWLFCAGWQAKIEADQARGTAAKYVLAQASSA